MEGQEKFDFLKQHRLFRALQDDEVFDLMQICKIVSYQKGDFVTHQGEVADTFYLVRSGRFESYQVKRGVVSDRKVYTPSEYFQDIWLFKTGVHDHTVLARTDGDIWTITEDDFYHFVERHPRVQLNLSPAAQRERERSGASEKLALQKRLNLTVDEHLLYESRRTPWLLVFELGGPIFLATVMPTVAYLLGRTTRLTEFPFLLPTLLFVIFIIPALWGLYRYIDWANDHLTITEKYLRHREFDLRRFSAILKTIPVDQIQGIRTNKPTFIESQLGIGTVSIKTASLHGGLTFDKLTNPNAVEKTLGMIRSRGRRVLDGRMREDIRRALEGQFEVPEPYSEEASKGMPVQGKGRGKRKKRVRRQGNRFEQNGEIIYGRHGIVLFWKVWWIPPLIISTILLGFLAWELIAQIPFTLIMTGLVVLLESFLYYYFFEDWKNDVFQLTADSVIDIDRTSFRFTESRKVARLTNVQNVNVTQPNVWAALFNYGDVTIDTAGASGNIVFEDVANPNKVQTDILERREQFMRSQKSRDVVSRRREIAIMLDYYQKLREQQNIQQRTPDFDEALEENER
ncbi:MAG: cyclic nucleotide-binding domain-containing protein [Candidatus Promineifilaceae bacterium]